MSTGRWFRAAIAGGAMAAMACGGGREPHPTGGAPAITAEQRSRLKVETVAPVSFRPSVEVTGTVAFDGDRSTQLLCPISGPVSKILVEPGARVHAGQVLALVASPDYAAAVANYRKAAAAANNLEHIAELNQKLFDNDALARRDLEQSQTDAASAVADREAALEQLRGLGIDSTTLADIQTHRTGSGALGEVRAPIEGTVVEKLISPGQLLQAGSTPCFTIAGLGTVWVMANVFETELPYVSEGDSVLVRPTDDSDRVFRGRVTYVGALVDPNTRATAVRVLTTNSGEALRRDMYVRAEIHSRKPRTGFLLPSSAVLRDEENLPFVFVVKNDSAYARQAVTVGSHVGDRIEITRGINVGDRVISDGALFVQFAESQ
ncbi:MAG TPA: efflux RND transporter periplasmic adaptor subunit [Gemmatimonadales bacterium]|nr:efflux RND transporter periplasmic adaptor subunit [Gemmatimonadales bacterium]